MKAPIAAARAITGMAMMRTAKGIMAGTFPA
jgi:hypothetical protein